MHGQSHIKRNYYIRTGLLCNGKCLQLKSIV